MINMMIALTQMGFMKQYDENKLLFLGHLQYIITFEFKQFECVCYKQMLVYLVSLLNIIT